MQLHGPLVATAAAFVTVFILFVVQHTTSSESNAILVKLDELIHGSKNAHKGLMNMKTIRYTFRRRCIVRSITGPAPRPAGPDQRRRD
ncbi:low affinity iron permease family protein [Rhodococcus maanshanensis]